MAKKLLSKLLLIRLPQSSFNRPVQILVNTFSISQRRFEILARFFPIAAFPFHRGQISIINSYAGAAVVAEFLFERLIKNCLGAADIVFLQKD